MALQKREKILAWVVTALIAVVAIHFVFSSLGGPGGNLENRRSTLASEVQRMKNRLESASAARKTLDDRRRRSLPSDPEAAQSLYETWLRQLATKSDLSDARITYAGRRHVSNVYYALRFRVRAKATLDELTTFLHGFYRAGHLHQIDSLTITPNDRGTSLGVQLTVEALSLAGAPATGELTNLDSARTLASLSDYREKIVGRNIFAPYTPPRRDPPKIQSSPPPPPVDKIDPLNFTELNSIVSVDGRPQAWINAKMSGEHYELFEGDEATIGSAKCKILRIGRHDVEIEIDGKPYRVSIGKSLRDGKALPSGNTSAE